VTEVPITEGIAPYGGGRKAWLVDVWGVIHNGVAPFASSVATLQTYRRSGGFVVLVTNAPRPSGAVLEQLDRLGVPRDSYDAIVTSGDVTRGLIEAWKDKRIHHLGPERDLPLFADLNIPFVTTVEAEIVVCTGLHNDETETPANYNLMLKGFRRRNAAMICANPDIKVERGDRIVYCAGALGEAYEALGGDVIYAGKPHAPIYELAMGIIANALGAMPEKSEVLAVGDGVPTDIKGARDFGIDCVYIRSGITLGSDQMTPEAVNALFDENTGWPLAALPELAWT
jgi:HAD superfamily hydrolase (TIGR01459 family)